MKVEDLWNKTLALVADIRVYAGGLILWGDSHYKIKGPHQREILGTVKAGDILLRRYEHYLGSVTIPGYWSHAALYVGDDMIIHMLGDGITKEDILTFMRCDDIAILRCSDEARVTEAIHAAETEYTKGTEYDYRFDSACPDHLYCTELVNNVFGQLSYERGIKNWILPDDMLQALELDVVWKGRKPERWERWQKKGKPRE